MYATKIAFYAAIIHDMHRIDDDDDPDHGLRAASNNMWVFDELGIR
jgi:hypothetical protein